MGAAMNNTPRIAALNDLLRQTLLTGRVVLTPGVQSLPPDMRERVLEQVRNYDDFRFANDPYGERDMGGFALDGQSYFWKIDYYDKELRYLSDDPANAELTTRVLTVMLADEY